MLVEIFNGKARDLVQVTMIEELPAKNGFLGRDTPAINLHFEKYSTFSAITEKDGSRYMEVEISYDDFIDRAQKAAADPKNPLNIVDLKNIKYTRLG